LSLARSIIKDCEKNVKLKMINIANFIEIISQHQ
jgi:hypothetical protein